MAKKIMVIRHAEEHDDAGVIAGVTVEGRPDTEDLTVRGWQRAGALIGLFLPPDGVFVDRNLATPDAIFASGIGPHSKSQRPQNTVAPLAAKLGQQYTCLINSDVPDCEDAESGASNKRDA